MFNISFSEAVIIILVSACALKPENIGQILKQFTLIRRRIIDEVESVKFSLENKDNEYECFDYEHNYNKDKAIDNNDPNS